MRIHRTAGLGAFIMLFSAPPRVTERALGDIGVISLPTSIKTEYRKEPAEEQLSRLTFQFHTTFFSWFPGGVTAYKQLMVVSIMAPDATEAEYSAPPRALSLHYEARKTGKTQVVGSGTLTVTEGIYSTGSVSEPAVEYFYVDKARRLQLAWHAVKKDMDPTTAVALIGRIAASFRIVRDPLTTFAAMRAAPGKAADARARKLKTVKAMLQREGYGGLVAGKPVLTNGVYLEWMQDPEPRYQLLVPLGRIRALANGSLVGRPRPAFREGDANAPRVAGQIGWREINDGDWRYTNDEHAYLPMDGIGALMAAQQQDRAFVYFYYAATVRVEEEDDERLLTSLRWFLDGVPEIQRRWREGTLVKPGTPEKD